VSCVCKSVTDFVGFIYSYSATKERIKAGVRVIKNLKRNIIMFISNIYRIELRLYFYSITINWKMRPIRKVKFRLKNKYTKQTLFWYITLRNYSSRNFDACKHYFLIENILVNYDGLVYLREFFLYIYGIHIFKSRLYTRIYLYIYLSRKQNLCMKITSWTFLLRKKLYLPAFIQV